MGVNQEIQQSKIVSIPMLTISGVSEVFKNRNKFSVRIPW